MAIRHQCKSEQYPYASPTTPGLYVTFRAYIIELICLNVNHKIGPRFWSDRKYWGPKFRREIKGVENIFQQLEVLDAITQTAFVQIIKEHNIKSLTYKSTVKRVSKNISLRKIELEKRRAKFQEKQHQPEINIKKNSTFVDTGKKNLITKIREAEGG